MTFFIIKTQTATQLDFQNHLIGHGNEFSFGSTMLENSGEGEYMSIKRKQGFEDDEEEVDLDAFLSDDVIGEFATSTSPPKKKRS